VAANSASDVAKALEDCGLELVGEGSALYEKKMRQNRLINGGKCKRVLDKGGHTLRLFSR